MPGKIVSRAWACVRPTSGIHNAVESSFDRGVKSVFTIDGIPGTLFTKGRAAFVGG